MTRANKGVMGVMGTHFSGVIVTTCISIFREMKEAEKAGDEMKKRRAQIALHYLLIKMYTLEAIILENAFKFNALTFFKLSMKVSF